MARALLLDTPTANWSAAVSVMPDTQPVFGFGAVFYADAASGQVMAVDFQTGAPLWTASAIPAGGLATPALCGAVLYVATDAGELYAASPVTGALLWDGPVGFAGGALTSPVTGVGFLAGTGQPGPVIFLMDAENVYQVGLAGSGSSPPQPVVVFSAPGSLGLGTSLVYDGSSGNMIVNTSRGLTALAADTTSADPWGVAWGADLGGYATPATLAMGKAFVGTADQTMALVDASSGEFITSAALGSNVEQPVSVDVPNNVAYVPTDSGTIFQLDATSAAKVVDFQPGGQVTTPILQSDGVAYYGSADKSMYAFDLADATGSVVSLEVTDPVAYVAGVSSGTTYFGTQAELQAGAFAELVHEFNSQSQLMVDFVGSQASFAQVPAYQSNVVLYDPQGNVRPGESVKVWASAPVTLMTDNQSFAVDADTPAAFESDAGGHVVVSVAADTDISSEVPSGLSTPALTLWASFMDPDERILIFPDQRLHASLQTITGQQLQSAVTYGASGPGQPGPALLPSGFQGPDGLANASSLASAISNTVVLQPPGGGPAGEAGSPYLAYPETMLGVSCSPVPPATARPALPGAVPNWQLSLSGSAGASFTPVAGPEEAVRAAAVLREARVAGGSPPGSIFSDIGDFIDNVIKGTEKIAETVWQATADVVSAVIHTAENEYHLAIVTVEDAAHVVLGLLTSVLGDVENAVEQVIEALSFLFDWGDILATHQHVKSIINNGFDQATASITSLEGQSDDFFAGLASSITTEFKGLIASIGPGALSASAGSTDPNQAYTTTGSDNHSVQGNWLYHKTMSNSVGTGGQVSIGSATAERSLAAGASDPAEIVAQAMLTFVGQVGADALAVAEDLGDLVVAAVKELMSVLLDPGGAGGAQLASLLGALESLALQLVQLGKDAADDFFGLLEAVVSAVQDLLDASIDIPFVTWLYKEISGDDLSILDLFALIVAVPITVMCKALTGQAPFVSGTAEPAERAASLVPLPGTRLALEGTALNIENMIWTFNALIYAFVDCFSNAMGSESPSFLSYAQGVSGAISQGLSFPTDATGNETRDWGLLWIYEWFPAVWNVHSGMEAGAGNTTSSVVLPVWGIGSALWQAVYAGMYPSEFFDDGIKLVQNELGCLSTIAGFAKLSDNPDVLAVLLVADFFLDMASALIEIKYWWS